MSRNGSGTMAALSGPYSAGSVIDQVLVNARLADIESEISASLCRDAKGAMRAQLGLFDGTVAAPGLGFGSEGGSGLWRAGAGDVRLAILGVDAIKVTATAVVLTSKVSLASGSTPVAMTPNASVTAGNGLAYWLDATGTVHLKGKVTNGTGGTINNLITSTPLPAGFRPSFVRTFVTGDGSAGYFNIQVATSGQISCVGSFNGTTSAGGLLNGGTAYLDGITFLAEA